MMTTLAQRRAAALLRRHLTPAQKRKLTTDQCFEVQGERYAYRIYVRRHAPPDNYGYATIYERFPKKPDAAKADEGNPQTGPPK